MNCSCGSAYRCGRCGGCYQCDHVTVSGSWPGISIGWRCPDGHVEPAYGPGLAGRPLGDGGRG